MSLNKLRIGIGRTPILGVTLRFFRTLLFNHRQLTFTNSKQYWEDRYRSGRNSGAGSYGKLAEFKSMVINDFVKKYSISSIVEFGCGDGALAKYVKYIGFDVSETSVEICKKKFKDTRNFEFFLVGRPEFYSLEKRELALSLDVIYHLIEEDVFDNYMRKLFNSLS